MGSLVICFKTNALFMQIKKYKNERIPELQKHVLNCKKIFFFSFFLLKETLYPHILRQIQPIYALKRNNKGHFTIYNLAKSKPWAKVERSKGLRGVRFVKPISRKSLDIATFSLCFLSRIIALACCTLV